MKLWLDALTPKQGRLLAFIARELSSRGHKTLVTARLYDYTIATMKRCSVEPIVVGVYGGASLRGKLEADVERMRLLLEVVGDDFDVLVAYVNPSAARVAFGLGKPYVALTDSPHSRAVSLLSLPLASHVVYPSCIPRTEFEHYVDVRRTKLVPYVGVDEVLWLREFVSSKSILAELGLEELEYVVVRPPEIWASYHPGSPGELWLGIVEGLVRRGYTVVYMPRYGAEDPLLRRVEGRVVVPDYEKGVDGPSLEFFAAAVVTGGATMARESALLGTPGITLYPGKLYVNEFVSSLGLPLHRASSPRQVAEIVDRYARMPREELRQRARRVIENLESPLEPLLRILHSIEAGLQEQ